jgi:hypothetical protein
LICFCHNCNYSASFAFFLKTFHPTIYSDYTFEKYRIDANAKPIINKPIFNESALIPTRTAQNRLFVLPLPLVSNLPESHPARLYVTSRRLPEYPFMYADKFYSFSSQFNQNISNDKQDEGRLIIPFFTKEGNCFAYQGRDLSGKSGQKYITVLVDSKIPKLFGYNRVNFGKPVTIVEGPLDSLFLSNCIASVNANLISTARKLSGILPQERATIVFDNEPRNPTILSMYADAIKLGYNVVVWPKECSGIKDINDMVLSGLSPEKIIRGNTFSGLMAQIEFQKWKSA